MSAISLSRPRREFLYLYECIGLKYCNIVGLIDANPYKQKKFTVDSKIIMDSEFYSYLFRIFFVSNKRRQHGVLLARVCPFAPRS